MLFWREYWRIFSEPSTDARTAMQQISSKPFAMGKRRMCYVHPEDPRLAIKIPNNNDGRELIRREIRFYGKLRKTSKLLGNHLPRYHGACETNLGNGIVVDLVRSYDGEIARPLNWYLGLGFPIEEFEASLAELYQELLQHRVIFNQDLNIRSLLFRKTSASSGKLVAVNGFEDIGGSALQRLLPFLLKRRISRSWEELIDGVYHSREVSLQRESLGHNQAAD